MINEELTKGTTRSRISKFIDLDEETEEAPTEEEPEEPTPMPATPAPRPAPLPPMPPVPMPSLPPVLSDTSAIRKKILNDIYSNESNEQTLTDIVDVIRSSTGSESWYDTFKNALYDWVDAYGAKQFKTRADVDRFITAIRTGKKWRRPKILLEHEARATITDKLKGNERIIINPMLLRSIRIK